MELLPGRVAEYDVESGPLEPLQVDVRRDQQRVLLELRGQPGEVDPAKAEDRLKMWSDIYMAVMEDAPWAPVFNEQRFTMKSARMGGADALYVDPVSIPVNYDYVFIKE